HATPHTSVQHLVLDPLGRTCEHDETDEEGHRQTRQWPQDPGAGPDTDTDEDGEDQQSHGHRERDAAGTLLMDDLGDHPDLFEATGLLLGTTRAGRGLLGTLGLFRHRALRRLAPTRPVSGTFSKTLSRLASSSRSTCDALRRHPRGAFGTRICGRCLLRAPVAGGPPLPLGHHLDGRVLTRRRSRPRTWPWPVGTKFPRDRKNRPEGRT